MSCERLRMRPAALLVAATIGVACCCAVLLTGGHPVGMAEAFGAGFFARQEPGVTVAAPPHHMRGWAHSPPRALWWPDPP